MRSQMLRRGRMRWRENDTEISGVSRANGRPGKRSRSCGDIGPLEFVYKHQVRSPVTA